MSPPVLCFRPALVALVAGAVLTAGCGGGASLKMSAKDNDAAAIARALNSARPRVAGKPANVTGRPLAFLVTGRSGSPRLVAWDLAAGKARWDVRAEVTSRVVVGATLVAAREGKSLVARDVRDGAVRFRRDLGGDRLLGLAADGTRVVYVASRGENRWVIVAVDDDGDELWRTTSEGMLGAPVASGGVVYVPYLTQWLVLLDSMTGEPLARVRQADEAIQFVRATSTGVYYGSRGIFRLDERSASGTRAGSTYAAAKLPSFVRQPYAPDAFSSVGAEYNAFDRNRLLWWPQVEKGRLGFAGAGVVVFSYRYFFGFDARTGALRWANRHPSSDVAAAAHTGRALVYASSDGEVGALDPATGATLASWRLRGGIEGATFDAEGWRPRGKGTPAATAEVLAAIAVDRDARFNATKRVAVEGLGLLDNLDAVRALIRIVVDPDVPPDVARTAAEVLITRKDPGAGELLVAALDQPHDHATGARPHGIAALAHALGARGDRRAVPRLVAHLEHPATPLPTVRAIAQALGRIEADDAAPALRRFLLLHRADPAVARDDETLGAVIEALLTVGGRAGLTTVKLVAQDRRSIASTAEVARRALASAPGGAKPAR